MPLSHSVGVAAASAAGGQSGDGSNGAGRTGRRPAPSGVPSGVVGREQRDGDAHVLVGRLDASCRRWRCCAGRRRVRRARPSGAGRRRVIEKSHDVGGPPALVGSSRSQYDGLAGVDASGLAVAHEVDVVGQAAGVQVAADADERAALEVLDAARAGSPACGKRPVGAGPVGRRALAGDDLAPRVEGGALLGAATCTCRRRRRSPAAC